MFSEAVMSSIRKFRSFISPATLLLGVVMAGIAHAQEPPPRPAVAHDTTSLQAPPKAAVCMSCHGANGNSQLPLTPVLAGQTGRYIYLQLRDFQEGRRSNELMSPMAKDLTRDEMRELGAFFAAQKPMSQDFRSDPDKSRLGKAKADETLCTMCHQGGFQGQNEVPRVAGQRYDYIVKQLSDFKARRRTNDAGNMTSVSNTLSDTDIENLAHYMAGL